MPEFRYQPGPENTNMDAKNPIFIKGRAEAPAFALSLFIMNLPLSFLATLAYALGGNTELNLPLGRLSLKSRK